MKGMCGIAKDPLYKRLCREHVSLDKTSNNCMAWDKSKARNETYWPAKNVEVQFEEAREENRRTG